MRRVLAGVALVVAIGVAQRLIPDADRIYQPIASHGGMKEDVAAPPYTLRVDGVELGRTLTVGEERKTTQGVWVVLRMTGTATQEAVRIGDATLVTRDGTRYGASDRLLGFDFAQLEPGIPRSGSLAFELPWASAEGAVLHVDQGVMGALGPAVDIDLAVTGLQPKDTVIVERSE
ncbi:hypothetical protein ACIBG8_30415 [Nonomuraea sp. NPDC050556]|uniref:hypothetical protein n=1 Tax=Nonomuraea sp. NPDC050556 TaxID=3364369 RepID=UPI00379EB0FA